ncbi:MAG: hypothetical protein ACWA5W_07010 [Phycisphaerales bacterium]
MHLLLAHPVYTGLIAALLFELLTIVLRFRFKMTSPTHTRPIGKLTGGYRIHHGYPGIGMIMLIPLVPFQTVLSSLVIIVALMLFVSDLIHHAIILPIFAGGHEFEIKYPDHPHQPSAS